MEHLNSQILRGGSSSITPTYVLTRHDGLADAPLHGHPCWANAGSDPMRLKDGYDTVRGGAAADIIVPPGSTAILVSPGTPYYFSTYLIVPSVLDRDGAIHVLMDYRASRGRV